MGVRGETGGNLRRYRKEGTGGCETRRDSVVAGTRHPVIPPRDYTVVLPVAQSCTGFAYPNFIVTGTCGALVEAPATVGDALKRPLPVVPTHTRRNRTLR
jgi:hypothetical protein